MSASVEYVTGKEYAEEQCVVNDEGDDREIAIYEHGEPGTAVVSDTYVPIKEMR